MTLIQMEYFIAAAKADSFTEAADRLHVTQQSLSAGIAALETELGCRLFVRKTPLVLTYAGSEFLPYAGDILRRLDVLRSEMDDIRADRKGTLRLGIASTRARAILPDILARFRNIHPGIQIVIKENTNEGLSRLLQEAELDLAIANFDAPTPGLALRDFYRETICLFAAEECLSAFFGNKKEAAVREWKQGRLPPLSGAPFVLGNPKDIAGRIGNAFLASQGITPTPAATADNVELLLALCEKGMGFCFCPDVLAKAALSAEQYHALQKFPLNETAAYPIRFAYRTDLPPRSAVLSFMETAVKIQAEKNL